MNHDELKQEMDDFNTCEAAEQTLLSWMQLGLALIGLGFGLGSVLSLMKAEHYQKFLVNSARIVGQLLIVFGFVTIILSLMQHRKKIKGILNREYIHKSRVSHLSLYIGIMLSILGMIAFFIILIHMLL